VRWRSFAQEDETGLPQTAGNRAWCSGKGKRILEELQQKASDLSTLLGREAAKKSAVTLPKQAGSSSRTYMPNLSEGILPGARTLLLVKERKSPLSKRTIHERCYITNWP